MLNKVVGISHEELLACAYALFALWASDFYPKTATPINHLFGVMTGSAEFFPDEYNEYWQGETLYKALLQFLKV
jgi:hypothetical protein